jgi:hypothetical protein
MPSTLFAEAQHKSTTFFFAHLNAQETVDNVSNEHELTRASPAGVWRELMSTPVAVPLG